MMLKRYDTQTNKLCYNYIIFKHDLSMENYLFTLSMKLLHCLPFDVAVSTSLYLQIVSRQMDKVFGIDRDVAVL